MKPKPNHEPGHAVGGSVFLSVLEGVGKGKRGYIETEHVGGGAVKPKRVYDQRLAKSRRFS